MNKRLLQILLFFSLVFFGYGCIEQIEFPIEEAESKVVVDGTFSSLEEVQEIKLSWSVNVNLQIFDPYSGAIVKVEEEGGEEILFQETEPGIYTAFAKAEPDNKYRINVELQDGSIVTSRYQRVPESFPVTEVTVEDTIANFINESGQRVAVRAIECYAISKAENIKEELFLRYDLETVWQLSEVKCSPFHTPKSCYIYDKGDQSFDLKLIKLEPQGEAVNFSTFILRKPIDRTFGEVFSLKVDLLSYNQAEYRYWETLQNIFGQSGNITDILPARLPKDLKVQGDAEVFGTFAVVGKSSYLRFIRNSDFPTHVNPFCGVPGFKPYPLPGDCCACQIHPGATVIKPRYW